METFNEYTTKEERIAELKRQIKEIESEAPVNYTLVKVTPDCGAGVQDKKEIIAISSDMQELIKFCEREYNFTPRLSKDRPKDGLSPCHNWYQIAYSNIQNISTYPTYEDIEDYLEGSLTSASTDTVDSNDRQVWMSDVVKSVNQLINTHFRK